MKKWIYKHLRPLAALSVWALAVGVALTTAAGMALADDSAQKAAPIHIQSDRLVTQSDSRSAEFIGHVKVRQGQTTITADRLKLVYKTADTARGGMDADSIESLTATGDVRIELDDRIAESQKAVYTTADKKLVLSGPGSKVISGQDVIEGSVITFYRESGRVEMVGDKKNPVKAIIRSNQRGLN